MEPYTLKKLSGEPIIIFAASAGFSIAEHLVQASIDAAELIGTQPQAVYYIQDLRLMRPPDMDELMFAASLLGRGQNPLYHHPQIRCEISVTDNEAVIMSLEGMNSEMFGNINTPIFATMDEALAFARSGG